MREAIQAFCGTAAVAIAKNLKAAVDEAGHGREIGFTVFIFDTGIGAETCAYASSVGRGDFLKLLDEMRGKLAATLPDDEQPPGAN